MDSHIYIYTLVEIKRWKYQLSPEMAPSLLEWAFARIQKPSGYETSERCQRWWHVGSRGVSSELITSSVPLLSLTKTSESIDKQYTNTGTNHRRVGGMEVNTNNCLGKNKTNKWASEVVHAPITVCRTSGRVDHMTADIYFMPINFPAKFAFAVVRCVNKSAVNTDLIWSVQIHCDDIPVVHLFKHIIQNCIVRPTRFCHELIRVGQRHLIVCVADGFT